MFRIDFDWLMELLGFENYDDLKDDLYKWFKCDFIIIIRPYIQYFS